MKRKKSSSPLSTPRGAWDFLKRLLETPSPSSAEAAGQRVWLDYVDRFADEAHTDTYGNAVAVLNPKGSPRVMIAGHSDEIGFQIQYIDDDGFLYVNNVGGPDLALARGQRVHVHAKGGPVLGVFGSIAIHMQDREGKKEAPKIDDLYIDIGAGSRAEAEERVAVGDLVTYTAGCQQLTEDLWVARACDNRIGTFIAAEALRLCSEAKGLQACVIAASTIQEENGLFGAQMVGYSVNPDVAVVIDVAHATDIPGANKKKYGSLRMGKGPQINRGSVNHPAVVDRLCTVADKRGIPFQRGIDACGSGTDAEGIFIQRGGVAAVSIGVPNRYMHTPVETVHRKDLEQTAALCAAFALDLKSTERFRVKI